MRLESALYSSREGLSAHGQAIAVVGDNISNASTVGFKSSRIEFRDIVAGGPDGASASPEGTAGNGVAVARVRQIHETGVIEPTGRELDVGIEGQGYFILGTSSRQFYSRAGNFSTDASGALVNADGVPVLGYAKGDTGTLTQLNLKNVDLKGTVSSKAGIFGNLDASAATTILPVNPTSFKDVAATASYVANIAVIDSLGLSHEMTVGYYKTGTSAWTAQAYIDGGDVGGTKGVPVQVGQNLNLTFTSAGVIPDASKAAAVITGTPAYSNGAAAGNFTIDFSGSTQYAGASNTSSITGDGKSAGNIQGYEFHSNGDLYAVLDSGTSQLVGKVPLASFANEDGLQRAGNGLYVESETSGIRTVGSPDADNLGKLDGAALERSTVDIANQFIDLVGYQRGYQANSQTLNVANGMIRDTLGLLR